MSVEADYPEMTKQAYLARRLQLQTSPGAEMSRALDELDNLRRWKAEAECVIREWDHLWEMAGCPGQLGQTKAAGLLAALQGDGIL